MPDSHELLPFSKYVLLHLLRTLKFWSSRKFFPKHPVLRSIHRRRLFLLMLPDSLFPDPFHKLLSGRCWSCSRIINPQASGLSEWMALPFRHLQVGWFHLPSDSPSISFLPQAFYNSISTALNLPPYHSFKLHHIYEAAFPFYYLPASLAPHWDTFQFCPGFSQFWPSGKIFAVSAGWTAKETKPWIFLKPDDSKSCAKFGLNIDFIQPLYR